MKNKEAFDILECCVECHGNEKDFEALDVFRCLLKRKRATSTNKLKAEIAAIADEIEHGFCSPSVDSKLIRNGIQRLRKLSAV